MHIEPSCLTAKIDGGVPHRLLILFALVLCLTATGCLTSLQKHSVALSAATAPVIDQAAAAYHNAQALHDARLNFEAVAQFDTNQTIDPATMVSFPSNNAIQVRLTVLEAFKCYVDSLVEITNGTSSPELLAASKSVGGSLFTLSNTLYPTIEGALGETPDPSTTTTKTVTSSSTSTTTSATEAAPLVSPAVRNGISDAALALGKFLVNRKIKQELPQEIAGMDKSLKALCILMENDIDLLQDHDKRDFTYIKQQQTIFIQDKSLGAQEHRVQIVKLADLIRQQQAADQQFTVLRGAIVRLYDTHQALAVDAQGNNPESLKAKMSDLEAAGNDLGKFYASLSTH